MKSAKQVSATLDGWFRKLRMKLASCMNHILESVILCRVQDYKTEVQFEKDRSFKDFEFPINSQGKIVEKTFSKTRGHNSLSSKNAKASIAFARLAFGGSPVHC